MACFSSGFKRSCLLIINCIKSIHSLFNFPAGWYMHRSCVSFDLISTRRQDLGSGNDLHADGEITNQMEPLPMEMKPVLVLWNNFILLRAGYELIVITVNTW